MTRLPETRAWGHAPHPRHPELPSPAEAVPDDTEQTSPAQPGSPAARLLTAWTRHPTHCRKVRHTVRIGDAYVTSQARKPPV
jgi:hypothetical protein